MGKGFTKIISLVLCFSIMGCATYRAGKLPSSDITTYPHAVEKNGVKAAARVLRGESARAAFDVPLLKKGVQPVFLVIANKSSRTYLLEKSLISEGFIPAREVFKKFEKSVASRYVGYGSGVFIGTFIILWPLIFLAIPMVLTAQNAKRWNEDLERDLSDKEIPDGAILPHRSRAGVIFLPLKEELTSVTLTLADSGGGDPLVFELSD
jgi:hypothetical protein